MTLGDMPLNPIIGKELKQILKRDDVNIELDSCNKTDYIIEIVLYLVKHNNDTFFSVSKSWTIHPVTHKKIFTCSIISFGHAIASVCWHENEKLNPERGAACEIFQLVQNKFKEQQILKNLSEKERFILNQLKQINEKKK